MEKEYQEINELSGREDPEETSGVRYYTRGQMYRGDNLLVKVKIKEGTPEEVAADMAEQEGGNFQVFDSRDGLEEDEAYLVSD